MMTKLRHFVPEKILYSLYCTLVMPYINYGILIWGNTCKTYLDKILKLQKWTMRTVTNSHYRSHAAPLFLKHNVLNVNDSFRLNLGIFMYKHSQNHNYPTRNAQDHSINNNSKI